MNSEKAVKPKRVIFPFFWEGRVIQVMVHSGEKVLLDTGRRSEDEGWGRRSSQFEFDGEIVTREDFSEGRDCDGYLSNFMRLTCPVSGLKAYSYEDEDGTVRHAPLWEVGETEVNDEQARLAGY